MLKYEKIIQKLTLKQKIELLTDISCLSKPEFTKLGIPHTSIGILNDILSQVGDNVNSNILARSWNPESINKLTGELVSVVKHSGVNFIVTPSPKIKFSPYTSSMSEDPYLSGALAGAYLSAIYREGIPSCISGFKLDPSDVEYMDREIDQRIIYEYFVYPFLVASKSSAIHSVMGSVEGPGGEYGDLNHKLMASVESGLLGSNKVNVLCDEHTPEATAEVWHSGGIVVKGVASVLELAYEKYQDILQSIQEGHATVSDLEDAYEDGSAINDDMIDAAVDRVISFAFDCQSKQVYSYTSQAVESDAVEGDEELDDLTESERIIPEIDLSTVSPYLTDTIRESIVLLKNDGNTLPMQKYSRVAIIGDIAMSGRYAEFAKQFVCALSNPILGFARGYAINEDKTDYLISEADKLANEADIVFLFLGIDDKRLNKIGHTKQLELPANQSALLDALSKYRRKLVVVLDGDVLPGASFDSKINTLLLAPVGGDNCAHALVDVVYGNYNPSGRLTESYYDYPVEFVETLKRYKDNKRNKVGPFVGYRYYDSANLNVRYPFGFGLSYTSFKYSNLQIYGNTIEFIIKNTGKVTGSEVVQIYVGALDSAYVRPAKELKAFRKVLLKPGESKQLRFAITDLLTYDEMQKKFIVEHGSYNVYVGSSVSDIKLVGTMNVAGERIKVSEDAKQKRSDYLQSDSNIISDKYTLEAECKKMKKSWKWKIGYILCLIVALLINVGNWYVKINFTDVFDMYGSTIEEAIGWTNAILALLIVTFIVLDIIISVRVRRERLREDRLRSEKNFEDAQSIESILPDELFVKEFDEVAEKEKQIKVHSGFDLSDMSQFVDNDLTFAALEQDFIALAKDMGIVLEGDTAASTLAAFATSRLVAIESIKGEQLKKFSEVLAKFFNTPVYFEEINESFSNGNLLYVTDEDGKTRETAILKMINSAKEHKEVVHFVTLTNLHAADLANLFSQYIRYLNNPQRDSKITFKDMDENILLPENIWFVISPAKGQRVEELPIYMTELMTMPVVKCSECEPSEEHGEYRFLGYYQINYLAEKCKSGLVISEDLWKKMDSLEEYVHKHSAYKFGNKLQLRLEKYLSILCSCEFDMIVALDSSINSTILPVVQVALDKKIPDDDKGLLETMESLFGDENIPCCRRTLKKIIIIDDPDQVS